MKSLVCMVSLFFFFVPSLIVAQVVDEGVLLGGMQIEQTAPDLTGRFFVVFHAPPGAAERQMVEGHGAQIIWAYSVIPAFAVHAPNSGVMDAISQDPRVRYVDADKPVYALGTEADPEITDLANDQSIAGNATQDILKAWIQESAAGQLQFFIKVRDLSGVDPITGDGLGVNTIWKFMFPSLH